MNEVAAITHFFNFENDPNKVKSFIKFKEKLESQGIPLFVVEVLPEGGGPELKDFFNKDYYYLERILFPLLTEGNSLNFLSSKLPRHYKKIVWFDEKILVLENDWLSKCSNLLESYKLVRVNQNLKDRSPCMVNRDFFDKVGVFDFDFCGTSNLVTFSCLDDANLLAEDNSLMNLYKESNLDVYYKILSYKNDCDSYFGDNIKKLTLKTQEISGSSKKPKEDLIKLLMEIDVDLNISYSSLHKMPSLETVHGTNYSNNLLKLLK
mgnify:CR=1 FL=1|tara:strand:- start:7558 stop:8349 length:792 start_codon:yes stop_codon:yes gene_type:complete